MDSNPTRSTSRSHDRRLNRTMKRSALDNDDGGGGGGGDENRDYMTHNVSKQRRLCEVEEVDVNENENVNPIVDVDGDVVDVNVDVNVDATNTNGNGNDPVSDGVLFEGVNHANANANENSNGNDNDNSDGGNVSNDGDGNKGVINHDINDNGQHHQHHHHEPQAEPEPEPEPEPDWEIIAQHEPAKTDVPRFLAAQERRYAGDARFASALDEAHMHLKSCVEELLHIAADVVNETQERLDGMENLIKHDFVENEEVRSLMSRKLQIFAENARKQFQDLMDRLSNNGNDASGRPVDIHTIP